MRDDRFGSSALMPFLKPGTLVGRYELLCVVASGGMGAVWAGRLRAEYGFERKVAIKTILPQYAEESRFRELFLDEARLASRIIHSNVVQVLDLAEQDGVLFQAMEWVEGDSLRALVNQVEAKGEPFAWPIAVRIILEVAKGLHAAHELRDEQGQPLFVVHRDVSPQNILVGLDGSVRISDFGIAKARDRLSPETSKGNIKGKLRYMAPEQALGKAIDRRADVWSLGAVLYELLSGRPLFDAPNEAALLYEVVSAPPTLFFENPVHPRLLAVLRRTVSRSPDGRYSTAEAFAYDLRRAAKDANLEATTEDLAQFFQHYLAERCATRQGRVETAALSTDISKDDREGTKPSRRVVQQLAEEVSLSDFPVRGRTLSRLLHSIESNRRQSLVAGIALLTGFVLAVGWYLITPQEKLKAERALDARPWSLPVPSSTASSPLPPASVQVSSTPPTSVHVPTTSRPPRRTPSSDKKRPPFDDIDDGF